jgi:hypothetical protein
MEHHHIVRSWKECGKVPCLVNHCLEHIVVFKLVLLSVVGSFAIMFVSVFGYDGLQILSARGFGPIGLIHISWLRTISINWGGRHFGYVVSLFKIVNPIPQGFVPL